MVAGINRHLKQPGGLRERMGRLGRTEVQFGQVATAMPARAVPSRETNPEAVGCGVLPLRLRHFKNQNINESANI